MLTAFNTRSRRIIAFGWVQSNLSPLSDHRPKYQDLVVAYGMSGGRLRESKRRESLPRRGPETSDFCNF